MKRLRPLFVSLLLAPAVAQVAAQTAAQRPGQTLVRASDYNSFWLWAGVKARPEIFRARVLYLLQGEIGPDAQGAVRLKAQGAAQPGAHDATLWLAYRVRSLDWPPEILGAIRRKLALWRAQPGEVAGVQIDFDASTRGLSGYSAFLRQMRKALPKDCALSVTGLMDWASQGSPEDLSELSGIVDEVIFQTYRGRNTVENIDAYLARLDRLAIPFRLGLAEGATWPAPTSIAANKNFRGYVVFLRNAP